MDKDNNTKNVKQLLIENGLKLLNEAGYEDFSLRKVAAMSGVSHAAPYKHFKNKEDLINAICMTVEEAFKESLQKTALKYNDNPGMQLLEMGKSYVKFMVENPEYLKFLFLTPRKDIIKLKDNQFIYKENNSFSVFKDAASAYLTSIGRNPDTYITDILTIWSLVHGISILIAEKSISLDCDYMSLVSDMLYHVVNI